MLLRFCFCLAVRAGCDVESGEKLDLRLLDLCFLFFRADAA